MTEHPLEGPQPGIAPPESPGTAASTGATSAGASAGSSGRRGASAPAASLSVQQGRYYTPPPSVAPQASANRSYWGTALVCAVAAVAIGVGGWLAIRGGPNLPPPAAAAVKADRTFDVADADADANATARLAEILAEAVSAADLKAVNAPALADLEKQSPKMADELRNGQRTLYRVYLLDFLAQDGDQVELSVDGVSFGPVYLSNQGNAMLLPLAKGQTAQLKLVATADGGGGVTVGIVSSLGEARTNILQVGQSEQWQVTAK